MSEAGSSGDQFGFFPSFWRSRLQCSHLAITVKGIHGWMRHLRQLPSRGEGTIGPGTVRHHFSSLSNLYTWARKEYGVQSSPIANLMDGELPGGLKGEGTWLEIHETAWPLELALRMPAIVNGSPFVYPLLATFLLTGGRKSEALGLEVDGISFDRMTVTFRPYQSRGRLKNKGSLRTLPLWPQLAEILRPHIVPLDRSPRSGLLFLAVGKSGQGAGMNTNFDKALDVAAKRAGWQAVEDVSPDLRHRPAADA